MSPRDQLFLTFWGELRLEWASGQLSERVVANVWIKNWCGWVVSDGGCASHRQCLTVFDIVLAAPLADLSVEWRWGGFSCQRQCLFGAFASSLPAACCLFWYFACQLLVCFDLCQLLAWFDPCQLLAWFETFWEEWSAVGSACLFEWLAISDCSDWKWCLWEAKTKAIWVIGHFAASTHWWKLWRLGGLECLSFNLLVSLSVMQRGWSAVVKDKVANFSLLKQLNRKPGVTPYSSITCTDNRDIQWRALCKMISVTTATVHQLKCFRGYYH